MKFDLNLTITGIIALCAIISPILTSFIENKFKLANKKIDVYESRKFNALNEFINNTLNCISLFNTNEDISKHKVKPELLREYYKSANKLITLFPNVDINEIKIIGNQIECGYYSFIDEHLNNVIIKLSKEIKPKKRLSIKNIFHK